MDHVLAIDQSTAGTKAMVFTAGGGVVSRAELPHKQIVLDNGWVEHDPVEIVNNTLAVCRTAVQQSGVDIGSIKAVGISNQRETAVCWDRQTGKPVYNAIVWQCGRAADIAARLAPHADAVRRATGLNLSPYFAGAKYAWLVENLPQARQLLDAGQLCCGTVDSWLLYNLTEERVFKTDYSNASRTQLLNLDTLDWDEGTTALFGLRRQALAEICGSDSLFGHTTLGGLFPAALPILAVMGDSHAALYANGCHTAGMAKATYGTGTSVMMNVGGQRLQTEETGVVESLAWGIGGRVNYVLEGNLNYTGAIIKWLVEDIGLLQRSREAGEVAATVPDTGGVYLVPAFSGLSAPYWQPNARAMFCGMSRTTKRAHLVRAAEEAIAYQVKDIVRILDRCAPTPLRGLYMDGGCTRDGFLMQFVADMLGIDAFVSGMDALSAAGVAFLAARTAGCPGSDGIFEAQRHTMLRPAMAEDTRQALYGGWLAAVETLL